MRGKGFLLGAVMMAANVGAAHAQSECHLEGTPVPGFEIKSIPAPQFLALHQKMAPRGEGERWTTIPWQSDLGEARRKAAREGKPLFMWIMDGHPLGCT